MIHSANRQESTKKKLPIDVHGEKGVLASGSFRILRR